MTSSIVLRAQLIKSKLKANLDPMKHTSVKRFSFVDTHSLALFCPLWEEVALEKKFPSYTETGLPVSFEPRKSTVLEKARQSLRTYFDKSVEDNVNRWKKRTQRDALNKNLKIDNNANYFLKVLQRTMDIKTNSSVWSRLRKALAETKPFRTRKLLEGAATLVEQLYSGDQPRKRTLLFIGEFKKSEVFLALEENGNTSLWESLAKKNEENPVLLDKKLRFLAEHCKQSYSIFLENEERWPDFLEKGKTGMPLFLFLFYALQLGDFYLCKYIAQNFALENQAWTQAALETLSKDATIVWETPSVESICETTDFYKQVFFFIILFTHALEHTTEFFTIEENKASLFLEKHFAENSAVLPFVDFFVNQFLLKMQTELYSKFVSVEDAIFIFVALNLQPISEILVSRENDLFHLLELYLFSRLPLKAFALLEEKGLFWEAFLLKAVLLLFVESSVPKLLSKAEKTGLLTEVLETARRVKETGNANLLESYIGKLFDEKENVWVHLDTQLGLSNNPFWLVSEGSLLASTKLMRSEKDKKTAAAFFINIVKNLLANTPKANKTNESKEMVEQAKLFFKDNADCTLLCEEVKQLSLYLLLYNFVEQTRKLPQTLFDWKIKNFAAEPVNEADNAKIDKLVKEIEESRFFPTVCQYEEQTVRNSLHNFSKLQVDVKETLLDLGVQLLFLYRFAYKSSSAHNRVVEKASNLASFFTGVNSLLSKEQRNLVILLQSEFK